MRWILIGTLLVLSMGEVFADARRGGKPASVSGTGEPVEGEGPPQQVGPP